MGRGTGSRPGPSDGSTASTALRVSCEPIKICDGVFRDSAAGVYCGVVFRHGAWRSTIVIYLFYLYIY